MCVVIIILLLPACSLPEGDNLEKIADNGIKGIKPPEGCDIIDNIDEFEKVSDDQSYNRDTDASTSFDVLFGGTDTGEALYVNISSNWLIYCDKYTGNSGLLCGKPECEHTNKNCNAYIENGWGTQYYNGYLYTIVQNNNNYLLTKISVSGSEREGLGKLNDSKLDGGTIVWIIHRGYIYYCYRSGVDGTEDVFYRNNSNCIFRKSLEKDSEAECIMALPKLSLMEECQFVGSGSYMYMIIPTADETKGCLYRYNTENNKLEWFKELGNEIANVAIHDNKIYYSENNRSKQRTKMYCYDMETKEQNVIFEIDGLAGVMKYDEEYMYIAYEDIKGIWKKGIWNWKGEYIADLPSYSEFDEDGIFRDLAGSDNMNIYIYCMESNPEKENIYMIPTMGRYTVIEYIEKEDILDGEYEIKEWSQMGTN